MNDLLFELQYWGDCTNTYDEESKQYVYARLMGLKRAGFSFDASSKSVIDIGGGPVSMLLKCVHRGELCVVVDPLMNRYPSWVRDRYRTADIASIGATGENVVDALMLKPDACNKFDEAWIYNCLQHVEDPAWIISNARALAPVLRIFEWINIPAHEGHPHTLTREKLDEWIGGTGNVIKLDGESGCYGEAYYGVFSRA